MAKIQLRKIVNINPKLLKARQLLALLYIREEDWEKARRELEPCRRIDIGNVLTNHYLREVREMLGMEDGKNAKKKDTNSAVVVKSGNDVIIQPKHIGEPKGFGLFLNIAVGLLIGLAIGWFLLGPIRMRMAESGVEKELAETREELAAKSTSLEELKLEYSNLQATLEETSERLDSYENSDGENSAVKNLMLAQIEYDKGEARDPMVIAGYLANIDETYVEQKATEEFKTMYELMMSSVGGTVGRQFYEAGNEAYRIMDYTSAVENYEKAVFFDSENGDALFALANAYRQTGDKTKAKETYEKVTERFPGTENATRALGFIAELGE